MGTGILGWAPCAPCVAGGHSSVSSVAIVLALLFLLPLIFSLFVGRVFCASIALAMITPS